MRSMVGLIAKDRYVLSSMMAYEPPPGWVAYGATKSVVPSLTIPLDRRLASQGIRVIIIYPGYIDSPITSVLILRLVCNVQEFLFL